MKFYKMQSVAKAQEAYRACGCRAIVCGLLLACEHEPANRMVGVSSAKVDDKQEEQLRRLFAEAYPEPVEEEEEEEEVREGEQLPELPETDELERFTVDDFVADDF